MTPKCSVGDTISPLEKPTICCTLQCNKSNDIVSVSQKECDTQMQEANTTSSWHFIDWLASVTECINQKLYFELRRRRESLNFHVPEVGLLLCISLTM